MKEYRQFIFEDYNFDAKTKRLTLHYSLDEQLHFTESLLFDFDFVAFDPDVLDRALQSLFFMAGVSYYKAYIPPEIIIKQGVLDPRQAAFFSKTYQRGLGEFWYVNQLDPKTPVTFPATRAEEVAPVEHHGSGLLTSVGGGKDSLAAIEILRTGHPDLVTWSLSHRAQLTPLVERIGLPHYWVEREVDPLLRSLSDRRHGHVPISAIFACVGTIVAILLGKRDVVVANEQSANEPTLTYRGVAINHQYSKSQEFETDYQSYLQHAFGDSLRYYSFFRPLSELRIAEIFAHNAFDKYKDVFSSCNRAYVHASNHMSWCGECPKCAFVFLALTPFIDRSELELLWSGKNLLLDPGLGTMYRKLLGIEGDKPLECVGEVKESRAAMRLAQGIYPQLATYHFDLPEDYDYRALGPSTMPPEALQLLKDHVL